MLDATTQTVGLDRRSMLLGLTAASVLAAPMQAKSAAPRILTIGSGVTETVFALGRGRDVVATDATSVYPAAAAALPKITYPKMLAAEQVLAHRPDIVLVADEAGPRAAFDALSASGVRFVRLPEARTRTDIVAGIRLIAWAIGETANGEAMAQAMAEDLAAIGEGLRHVGVRRRAIALLGSTDAYRLIVAGRGSPAGIALGFAGAENVADGISGWSWLAPTDARDLAPEVVVSISKSATVSLERVLASPSLRDTPAGRDRRVAMIEELPFTGFGPRSAHAIHAVASQIYPETRFPPLPSRRWAEVVAL